MLGESGDQQFPNYLTGGYNCRLPMLVRTTHPGQGFERKKDVRLKKILSTISCRARINPEWQTAVQQTFNNIAKVEQRENAKRAESPAGQRRHQSNEDGDTGVHPTEPGRIMEESGRVTRGVEQWTDPAGETSWNAAGYNEARVKRPEPIS